MRPVRRQARIQPFHCGNRQLRQCAAEVDKPIDGQHADTAAIGENGQALSRKWFLPSERLGRGKKLVEIEDAQQARPSKRRIVDSIGTRKRTRVGRGCSRALRVTPRLDDDDRFRARRGPRRGHELLRVVDGFHVEQDGAGTGVGRKEIETIAEIHINLSPSETMAEKPTCR